MSSIIIINQSMNNCFPLGNQNSGGAGTENAGSWSLEENVAYTIFIDIHKKSMTSKKKMREMQFYDKLAAFVATRSCSQCRSHHQKLFNKFKYISKIREVFKTEIGVMNYKQKLRQGLEKMMEINRSFDLNQPTNRIQDASSSQQAEGLPQRLPVATPNPSLLPLNEISLNYSWNPVTMMMGPYGWFPIVPGLNPFMAPHFIP